MNQHPHVCVQWTTPMHLLSAHHLRVKIYQHTPSQTPPCFSDTTGNPQTDFVEVVSKRGGATTGKNGRTVAFVDCVGEVTDVDGQVYGQTVRTTECELLCTPKSAVSTRCKSCRQYRKQLHAIKSRDQQDVSSGRTAHNSHCNFRYLSQSESMQRFKSLQKQRKM